MISKTLKLVRNPPPESKAYLCETNVRTLFPEALTADIETVLANETGVVFADAARFCD